MLTIEYATAFKRDFKRESKGRHKKNLNDDIAAIIELLLVDQPLPEKLKDHNLAGNWATYRECHIKPDLLLIYRKDSDTLKLARLGSHSELFG
jgi:mRNA interferase YafQ